MNSSILATTIRDQLYGHRFVRVIDLDETMTPTEGRGHKDPMSKIHNNGNVRRIFFMLGRMMDHCLRKTSFEGSRSWKLNVLTKSIGNTS